VTINTLLRIKDKLSYFLNIFKENFTAFCNQNTSVYDLFFETIYFLSFRLILMLVCNNIYFIIQYCIMY